MPVSRLRPNRLAATVSAPGDFPLQQPSSTTSSLTVPTSVLEGHALLLWVTVEVESALDPGVKLLRFPQTSPPQSPAGYCAWPQSIPQGAEIWPDDPCLDF